MASENSVVLSDLRSLKNNAIAGFQWNLAGQGAVYAITLAGTVIMSRIVSPAEFGLFGMLTVMANLASLVVGLGLAHAIVQNQSLTQQDYSSLFWLNFLLGVVVALFFFLSASHLANFYHQPELQQITRVSSVLFVLYGASAVPLGLLSKRLAFRELVVSQVAAAALSHVVGITLALNNLGVWSLVAQALVNHAVYVALNFYFARWRPSYSFRAGALQKITKFARNFLPNQVLDFLSQNMDMPLVGKYFGKVELGYYGRAYALLQLPVNSLGSIFNKTFFPVFAALQANPDVLRTNYVRAVKYLSVSLMPVLLLTSISAKQVILFLFGPTWVQMAPLVSVLTVSAALSAYNNFNDSALASQGRTGLLLWTNVAEKILLIVSVFVGLPFGITGIVYAKTLAMLAMFVPKLWVLVGALDMPLKNWFVQQKWIFSALALGGCGGFFVRELTTWPIVNLMAVACVGAGLMLGVMRIAREPILFEGWQLFKQTWQQIGRKAT